MTRTLAFALILSTIPTTTAIFAAQKRSKEAVAADERAWADATVKADAATLTRLLAHDLNYIHSTGMIDSKTSFIDKLKSGEQKYAKLQHEGMEIRLYGDTAVVTATAQVDTSTKGVQVPPGRLRFIHVWYYSAGAWQLVAHQSLRVP